MRWASRLAVLWAAVALLGAGVGPAAAVVAPPAGATGATGAAAGPGGAVHTVTLITGDVVRLERLADGRQAATVEPGAGRGGVTFHTSEVDGDLRVLPADAVPYLISGLLDEALFNVSDLIADGYDDARSRALPLIVAYRRGAGAARSSAPALAGAQPGTVLRSIDARAVKADKRSVHAFWESIDDDRIAAARTAAAVPPAAPHLQDGIAKVWLDRRVRASLDRSVPRIGAPAAWRAGLDGRGVKVAVLDTGVDADHPDLQGKVVEERNFSSSPSVEDAVGHGTHVAATIAGSGAASSGARRGVAPGAALLSGKVLNDEGFGSESEVLAGMEWAAAAGADVVNLSLGGGATDGSDPLSQGLDRLSAETGALFVVAAGNDGAEHTVSSPGSADAALTVGAVDRADALAEFSSRGPRVGDEIAKPDITAPGVGIVAARASGTSLGTPVDERYTALSGTSMATPHVAGAAAILAQQHPAWTGARLKDALVSTARTVPGQSVYEQGGGRVDVARAFGQPLHATGSLRLGLFPNATAEARREVTYTNDSAEPVTLSIDATLRSLDGQPAPDGAVRPERPSVSVPPGAAVTVPVAIDLARLEPGAWSGWLTATGAGGAAVHTTLGLTREGPRHTLTFSALGRDGKPGGIDVGLLFGTETRRDRAFFLPHGTRRTIELEAGTYVLHGLMEEPTALGSDASFVVVPELRVTGDAEVVLDARRATRVEVSSPRPSEQRGVFSYFFHHQLGRRTITHNVMHFDFTRLYVTPTRPLDAGSFEFASRWQLVAPLLAARTLGRGGGRLDPFFLTFSPVFEGTRRLRLVAAGAGTAEELARAGVRGKVALLVTDDTGDEAQVARAAAAGAAGAMLIRPEGWVPWTQWLPDGERLPAVGMAVGWDQGRRLRDLAARGEVTLELTATPASPYLYDVMQVSRGRIPERVVHRVSRANSAKVATSYHDSGGFEWSKEQRFGWRPWQETAWGTGQPQRFVRSPHRRVEYVSAGDTRWLHRVQHMWTWELMNPLTGGMTDVPRSYRAGQALTERWFAPVVRPAIPSGVPDLSSHRAHDTMTIRIPEFVDAERGHLSFANSSDEIDTVSAKLFRDGRLVAERPGAWGDFPAVQARARCRLDLATARGSPEWRFATSTATSWRFTSERPAGSEPALLPLLQVDYDLDVDLRDRAPGGRAFTIGLAARHQDGYAGPGRQVAGLAAWASHDDGRTWQRASVHGHGHGRFHATLRHPRVSGEGGFVSLRVLAWDAAGNSVEQTVLRAYGLTGR